jgi:hypothetical protein
MHNHHHIHILTQYKLLSYDIFACICHYRCLGIGFHPNIEITGNCWWILYSYCLPKELTLPCYLQLN